MRDKKKGVRIDHLIVAILLFAMAAIAFINVISRYFFHFSFAATEEITINMFVWMTVIGTGIAFERGAQMGMVTLFNIFPSVFRKVIIIFSAGLSAILFILVDYFMIRSVYDELTIFHATSGALDIPVWIYYVGVPVFSVFVFMGIYKNAVSRLEENQ
jgi:TRAP-type C4-dicarboxylate transport system permease small subunit